MLTRSLVAALPLLGILAASSAASPPAAASNSPIVIPVPRPVAPWVKLTGFERLPPLADHPDQLRYQVGVASSGVATSGALHYSRTDEVSDTSVPFSIGEQATAEVPMVDTKVELSCYPRSYDVWLEGAGMDSTVRVGTLATACSFWDTVSDSFSRMTPDMRNYQRANKVSLGVVTANASCGLTSLDVDLVNKSAATANGMLLRVTSRTSNAVLFQDNLAPIPGATTTHVSLSSVPTDQGSIAVTLYDAFSNVAAASQEIDVTIQSSCAAYTNLW
jgi:hypothetical protein